MLGFPLDLPANFVTWLEGRMQLLLEASNILGLASRVACVGDMKIICKDLSAETGLYVWDDAQGTWLYCNGNSFTAAAYPHLNTFLGGLVLPDARGRSVWMTGTNGAVDLLDNDGVAEASRQPKHTHSDTLAGDSHTHGSSGLSVTGAPGVGSLALPNHVHSGSAVTGGDVVGSAPSGVYSAVSSNTGNPTTNPAIDGAPSLGTLDVGGSTDGGTVNISGSVGSGMSGSDAVAHCVVGSLLIKAD